MDFELREEGNGARRAPMRVGLLQVVTEDAGELLRPIGRLALQPIGEPFVETSTVLEGHAVIGGEPDRAGVLLSEVSEGNGVGDFGVRAAPHQSQAHLHFQVSAR